MGDGSRLSCDLYVMAGTRRGVGGQAEEGMSRSCGRRLTRSCGRGPGSGPGFLVVVVVVVMVVWLILSLIKPHVENEGRVRKGARRMG